MTPMLKCERDEGVMATAAPLTTADTRNKVTQLLPLTNSTLLSFSLILIGLLCFQLKQPDDDQGLLAGAQGDISTHALEDGDTVHDVLNDSSDRAAPDVVTTPVSNLQLGPGHLFDTYCLDIVKDFSYRCCQFELKIQTPIRTQG